MPKSPAELHQALMKLEKSMLLLIEKYPEDQKFMSAFVHEADTITGQAAPEDHSWIHGQVGCILEEYGKLHERWPDRITSTQAIDDLEHLPPDPEPPDPIDPAPPTPIDPLPAGPIDPKPPGPIDPSPSGPIDPTPSSPTDSTVMVRS